MLRTASIAARDTEVRSKTRTTPWAVTGNAMAVVSPDTLPESAPPQEEMDVVVAEEEVHSVETEAEAPTDGAVSDAEKLDTTPLTVRTNLKGTNATIAEKLPTILLVNARSPKKMGATCVDPWITWLEIALTRRTKTPKREAVASGRQQEARPLGVRVDSGPLVRA